MRLVTLRWSPLLLVTEDFILSECGALSQAASAVSLLCRVDAMDDVDFQMVSQPCRPGINPLWLPCTNRFMCC